MNDVKGMNATNAVEKQRPYQRAAAGGHTVPLQRRPAQEWWGNRYSVVLLCKCILLRNVVMCYRTSEAQKLQVL